MTQSGPNPEMLPLQAQHHTHFSTTQVFENGSSTPTGSSRIKPITVYASLEQIPEKKKI